MGSRVHGKAIENIFRHLEFDSKVYVRRLGRLRNSSARRWCWHTHHLEAKRGRTDEKKTWTKDTMRSSLCAPRKCAAAAHMHFSLMPLPFVHNRVAQLGVQNSENENYRQSHSNFFSGTYGENWLLKTRTSCLLSLLSHFMAEFTLYLLTFDQRDHTSKILNQMWNSVHHFKLCFLSLYPVIFNAKIFNYKT